MGPGFQEWVHSPMFSLGAGVILLRRGARWTLRECRALRLERSRALRGSGAMASPIRRADWQTSWQGQGNLSGRVSAAGGQADLSSRCAPASVQLVIVA